jgi:hypothetical protein
MQSWLGSGFDLLRTIAVKDSQYSMGMLTTAHNKENP